MAVIRDAAGVNLQVSEMGFNHGTLEGATTGACKCEWCLAELATYCAPNRVGACFRLPGHSGGCSASSKDRTLDLLAQGVMELNYPRAYREHIIELIKEHQS